ncbi:serine protease gd [Anabrus simplex]|uniref:serine protease gd n=1 Tax=Anabrus simplex TaxID=316456 RepID=UPI0035A36E75
MWTVIFLVVLSSALGSRLPPSPCPEAYGYEKDEHGELKGLIGIMTPPRYSEVQVQVVLSLPVPVTEGEVGELSLKGGKKAAEEATRQVLMGRPHVLQFYITFPPGKPVPTLLKITVNNKDFCVSKNPPSDTRARITLHSFLSTGVMAPPSKDFAIVGSVPIVSVQQEPTHIPEMFNHRSTTEDPDFGLFFAPSTAGSSTNTKTTTTRPTTRRTTTSTSSFVEDDPPEDYEVNPYNCGVPDRIANTLVVYGTEAERGEWPWQIALFKNTNIESSTGITFQCGGTLVTRRHVITAAHCVVEKRGSKFRKLSTSSLAVFMGKNNIRSWAEEGQQAGEVEEIIVHPSFNIHYNNDISILLLTTSVHITQFVKPICLWDRPADLSIIEGQVASVAGWGKDESGSLTDKLRVAKMPVVSQETCLRSDSFYATYTSETTLCASFRNGTTVCNGDSGGGLSLNLRNPVQKRDTWYLRGVVSVSRLDVGDIPCDIHSFVIFTDVAKYTNWLKQHLRKPT